jgi:hypothetical protein
VITARLHALARQAASPKAGKAYAGGTLELYRGENRQPLLAHVIPLAPNRTVAIFNLDRPTAALFVIDQGAELRAQIHRFAASYGLTAAETRVFAEIIAGNGSRRGHAAQNYRANGAYPYPCEAHFLKNRNQASDGAHSAVLRDRLHNC